MKFYLRVVNPVIALLLFILCFWASTVSDEKFSIFGIIVGGMNTYFFAKGLYTSCSLLILGRVLLEILNHSEKKVDQKYTIKEMVYSISFGVFTIGSLFGLILLNGFNTLDTDISLFKKKQVPSAEKVQNPKSLEIFYIHRVMESEKLKYSGKIYNNWDYKWNDIRVEGKLIIHSLLADKAVVTIDSLKSMDNATFVMNFDDFLNKSVPDSAKLDLQIEARK
jgi:hypothetical protein